MVELSVLVDLLSFTNHRDFSCIVNIKNYYYKLLKFDCIVNDWFFFVIIVLNNRLRERAKAIQCLGTCAS